MDHIFFPVAPPFGVVLPLLLSLAVPVIGGLLVLQWNRLRRRSLVTTLVARSAILGGTLFALIATVATMSVLRTGLAELHTRHLREVAAVAQTLVELSSGDSASRAEIRPRLALFLAPQPNVGFAAIRWFDCRDRCVMVLGDSLVSTPAATWLRGERGTETARPGTTLTLAGTPYLLVGSVLRDRTGRPMGALVAGVNATTVVIQARDTAWLLVGLTTMLLILAVWMAQRALIVSVAGRVRTIIGRLESSTPTEPSVNAVSIDNDELGILSRRVQAHIDRSLDRERESDRRFQQLVDASPDAVVVTTGNRIIYTNEAALRLVGVRDKLELVGSELSDFLSTDSAVTSEPIDGQPALQEGELRRRDGSHISVEIAAIAFTYADERATQTTIRDVSARKRAEEAQRRTEEVYRELVDGAPYGMYRVDASLRFLTVNAALVHMIGFPSAEALIEIGTTRQLFVEPTVRESIIDRLRRNIPIERVEAEWIRHDGQRITVLLTGRKVVADDGSIDGFEMTVEDVTEQRTLEAQLRQAQKMEAVGQLTGGVAHDFNNLLTVILTNAELVASALPPDLDTAKADLGELRQAARRGAALVHKLLTFSRADRLERREIKVGTLLSDSAYMLRRVLPENITVKLPAEVPAEPIVADPVAIEQILLNLATNARDAMPQGGQLELTASTEYANAATVARHEGVVAGHFLRISVRDNGVGMDAATLARIFEPFFTTKPVGAGTGLGMAMVFGLVNHHHGFIDVESLPGIGTTVHIHLPIAPPAAVVVPSPPTATAEPTSGGATILVVEDEEPIRRATTRVLQRSGYRVILASDGLEGLEQGRAHRGEIDLVISDLMMPRMGGKAFFDAMRAEGDDTPFLFISGYTQESQEVFRGLGEHASYLNKPWELRELLAKIGQLLGRPLPNDA